ncbi:MAG: hypothetical protein QOJ32_495 [Frankiaceae bacterium]|jgi:hypothetical protein|nr:hypothetical protein [Frankiaceae bacterium]MDQ1633686.1 hypothetical protein [Frankiaceae bacterium]
MSSTGNIVAARPGGDGGYGDDGYDYDGYDDEICGEGRPRGIGR